MCLHVSVLWWFACSAKVEPSSRESRRYVLLPPRAESWWIYTISGPCNKSNWICSRTRNDHLGMFCVGWQLHRSCRFRLLESFVIWLPSIVNIQCFSLLDYFWVLHSVILSLGNITCLAGKNNLPEDIWLCWLAHYKHTSTHRSCHTL